MIYLYYRDVERSPTKTIKKQKKNTFSILINQKGFPRAENIEYWRRMTERILINAH